MSRSTIVSAMAFCAITLFSAAPASAQVKIAVINVQRAILETGELKKAQNDLQAKYKARQDAIEALQRDLNDIQDKIQKDGGRNPQLEAELQAQGTKKQRDGQRMTEDLQGDVERDRNDILQRVGSRMTEVVKKLAEEKGFDMVVDTTNVIFSKPALEITNDAIAAYDKAYPAK